MQNENPSLSPLVAEIVAAYVTNNKIEANQLPELINRVHQSFLTLKDATETVRPRARGPIPAVPVEQSVMADYLVCLEDGRRLKMLKRHLKSAYNLTPEQYRIRWNLPADYPMVAPNYAKKRSRLARELGLGVKERKRT